MQLHSAPTRVLLLLWLIWGLSWGIAAAWSDRSVKRAASKRQVSYNIVAFTGTIFLVVLYRRAHVILWRVNQPTAWCLVAISVVGLCFTWWARIHLGRLWSRWVVCKEHHRIVQSGPYSLVRHP